MDEIDVFISHSARDEPIARRLITLIRSALNLPSEKILCTSVDGFRLPAGTPIDEALRNEIHHSKAFIAIITPHSVTSTYVLFELGARWGAQKPMLPLLACGAGGKHLKGPLAAINALNCNNTAQLHQFVDDLARALGAKAGKAAAYQKCINELIEENVQCMESLKPRQGPLETPAEQSLESERGQDRLESSLSMDALEMLAGAAAGESGIILRTGSVAGLQIGNNEGVNFLEPGAIPREVARWDGALKELVVSGLIEATDDRGEIFRLTRSGYELADRDAE